MTQPLRGVHHQADLRTLICYVPYDSGQQSMGPPSSTATSSADTLETRLGDLKKAGEADRAAFQALTDGLAATAFEDSLIPRTPSYA